MLLCVFICKAISLSPESKQPLSPRNAQGENSGCVAKNRGRSVGIKFPSLFSLGCHSKQFSDERYLTGDLSFLRFLHLALFDYI